MSHSDSELPDPESWVNSPIGRIDRLTKPIENIANYIAGIAIFLLMVLGTAQIFLRTFLNSPVSGYIDLVELSMAGLAFLGAAYCQRLGSHIRMELLVGRLRGRWLWGFEIAGTLLSLFVIGVLVYYSAGHFLRSYQLGDTTIDAEFVVWPSKLLVPLAFSLWFIRLLVQLVGSIRLFRDPDLPPAGVALIHDLEVVAREEINEAFGDKALVDEMIDVPGSERPNQRPDESRRSNP